MNQPLTFDLDLWTERALELPTEAREILAHRLWEGLFPGEDADLSPEQLAELDVRLGDLDAGRTKLLDGDDVLVELRTRAASIAR